MFVLHHANPNTILSGLGFLLPSYYSTYQTGAMQLACLSLLIEAVPAWNAYNSQLPRLQDLNKLLHRPCGTYWQRAITPCHLDINQASQLINQRLSSDHNNHYQYTEHLW